MQSTGVCRCPENMAGFASNPLATITPSHPVYYFHVNFCSFPLFAFILAKSSDHQTTGYQLLRSKFCFIETCWSVATKETAVANLQKVYHV